MREYTATKAVSVSPTPETSVKVIIAVTIVKIANTSVTMANATVTKTGLHGPEHIPQHPRHLFKKRRSKRSRRSRSNLVIIVHEAENRKLSNLSKQKTNHRNVDLLLAIATEIYRAQRGVIIGSTKDMQQQDLALTL